MIHSPMINVSSIEYHRVQVGLALIVQTKINFAWFAIKSVVHGDRAGGVC